MVVYTHHTSYINHTCTCVVFTAYHNQVLKRVVAHINQVDIVGGNPTYHNVHGNY